MAIKMNRIESLLILACFLLSPVILNWPSTFAEETVPFPLWAPETPVPETAETPLLEEVRFSVIKKREPEVDGYNWLHGVALVWHQNVLFSFWGHNKSDENTPSEIAQGRHSMDGGITWSPVWTLASGTGDEGRSHGVFLTHNGGLWAFLARFGTGYAHLKTEAFLLARMPLSRDDASVAWEYRGIVAEDFWPCDRPVPLKNGNWIMAGARIPNGPGQAFPAVAVSREMDWLHWDVIALPVPENLGTIWGETTIIVDDKEVTAIIRAGGEHGYALTASSRDYGKTWTHLRLSNLPMPGTKAYAGTLSTGQRYAVGTFTRDHNGARYPLTLAVSMPGERFFSRLFRIRDALFPRGPGESIGNASLSYPYAVEHGGHLYVAYSNDGGRGRNLNSAEMAVIPLSALDARSH